MTVEVNWSDIGDLDKLIKETWEVAEPHLWFKLTHPPPTLRVKGIHALVLVDNKPRFDTRRKPPPFKDLVQAFSEENGFNFNKIKKEEIMASIRNVDMHLPKIYITIAINVSPLFKYHSLILPSPLECKGQIFDEFNLRILIDFAMKCTDQNMLILGNSLLAHASVNHIHYHLLYPALSPACTLASGELFISSCRLLVDYFFPGFLFVVTETNLSRVKYDLVRLIEVLQLRDIPHNIVVCKRADKATLVLVFPRKSTIHTQKSQGMPGEHKVPFFVAAAELAGIIPVTEGFGDLTESDCLAIMKETMLDDRTQKEMLQHVKVMLDFIEDLQANVQNDSSLMLTWSLYTSTHTIGFYIYINGHQVGWVSSEKTKALLEGLNPTACYKICLVEQTSISPARESNPIFVCINQMQSIYQKNDKDNPIPTQNRDISDDELQEDNRTNLNEDAELPSTQSGLETEMPLSYVGQAKGIDSPIEEKKELNRTYELEKELMDIRQQLTQGIDGTESTD